MLHVLHFTNLARLWYFYHTHRWSFNIVVVIGGARIALKLPTGGNVIAVGHFTWPSANQPNTSHTIISQKYYKIIFDDFNVTHATNRQTLVIWRIILTSLEFWANTFGFNKQAPRVVILVKLSWLTFELLKCYSVLCSSRRLQSLGSGRQGIHWHALWLRTKHPWLWRPGRRWATSGRRWATSEWRRRPTQVVEQAAAEEAKKRDTATGPATVMVEVSKSIDQMPYIVESSVKSPPSWLRS